MSFDFKTANDEQKVAIAHTEGPLLIIAGPGTGKTFTLIKRAMYLIQEKGVKPENILIATFTEKAAKEMLTRFSNELLEAGVRINVNDVYVGTFHSICLRILKENIDFSSIKKNFRLMDEFDQQYFIYQNFSSFRSVKGFDTVISIAQSIWDQAEEIAHYINSVTEELVDLDQLEASQIPTAKTVGELIRIYEDLRVKNNLLDFSSIQTETIGMLRSHPDLLQKIQDKIRYLMIDEYQDTNYVQEQLVFEIGAKSHNICVVGDDDQGLYRFRGATIRNILEFPTHFPECLTVKLTKNYRSEKDIVDFYNRWMDQSDFPQPFFAWGKYRYDKTIVPVKEPQVDANTVIRVSAQAEDNNYNQKMVSFVKGLLSSGKVSNPNQIAFLFRSVKNHRVKQLADYFEANGINVYSPRSDMFFEREEIMLLIASLLLIFPQYLLKMGNPDMHIDADLYAYYQKCINLFAEKRKKGEIDDLFAWVKNKGNEHRIFRSSTDYAFSSLVYEMLQFEPFAGIVDIDLNSGVADSRPARNVAIFTNLLVKFEYLNRINVLQYEHIDRDLKRLFNQYFLFLFNGGIGEYEDESEYAPSGCVSFMTIHQSKGMEFPIVVVGSLWSIPKNQNDEVITEIEHDYYHRPAFEPADQIKYFDFWRLFYTAFSRAQNLLVLTCEEKNGGMKEPSAYFAPAYAGLPTSTDLSKFSFQKIKNTNIKESYAFTSDIALYENCPMQYKYFKDLGMKPVRLGATLFGTLVHETIEDVHRAAIRGDAASIDESAIQGWLNANYATISQREHYYLGTNQLQTAYNQVLAYAEARKGTWDKIKDCEVPISLVKDDYILTGKVDLIEGKDNTVDIVDFKTEKKPNIFEQPKKVERVKEQLEVYAYILEQRYGMKVGRMIAYYTSETDGSPTIPFEKDEKKIKATIDGFDRIVGSIEKREYCSFSEDRKLCDECDMRSHCDKRRTKQNG
jgi:DNA helicase-2/ATP-dependent DNA helicase PcrA